MSETVLVLGATGLLGNAVLRLFGSSPGVSAVGVIRARRAPEQLSGADGVRFITGVDVENVDRLAGAIADAAPSVIVNCIGLVKQLMADESAFDAVQINALLPHRLARLSAMAGARLIHISTDCVFSGERGGYCETDVADATDLYGRSKLLGEVDYPNAVTLRTSIIGHELRGAVPHGLVGWFLSQEGRVRGFRRAIFSGLPTVELASVIRDVIIPHPELRGLYHVAATPIAKLDLLRLVASQYNKTIEIVPDDSLVIDRSLNAGRLRDATGYEPPGWSELVRRMHEFQ